MSNSTVSETPTCANQQLRMLNIALAAVTDYAYVVDVDGRLAYANEVLLMLWGMSHKEIIGRTVHEINGYPPELADKLHRQLLDVARTGKPVRGDTAYTGCGGVLGY